VGSTRTSPDRTAVAARSRRADRPFDDRRLPACTDLKRSTTRWHQGLKRGALIHEKTGVGHPVGGGSRRLAAAAGGGAAQGRRARTLRSEAKVRVELPLEGAVIFVPGRLRELRVDVDAARPRWR